MRLFSLFLLGLTTSVAAETAPVQMIDENTSVQSIRQDLFGHAQQADSDWESKGINDVHESKGIDEIVEDAPKTLAAQIQFALDSANIETQSYALLGNFAQALQNPPAGVTIEITGHTDCLGSQRYNQGLALERAQAVKAFLIGAYQLPEALLRINSQGETAPLQGQVATQDSDQACRVSQSDAQRAWNRRVEFRAE